MKAISKITSLFQSCFPPILAGLFLLPSRIQGQDTVVYQQFPSANGTNSYIFGGYSEQSVNVVINGHVSYTFYSAYLTFVLLASSSNEIVAVTTNVYGNSPASVVVAIPSGTEIGSGAAGYFWQPEGSILSVDVGDPIEGNGCIMKGFFPGRQAACIGIRFRENGQTFYGWVQVGLPEYSVEGGFLYDYAYETVPDKPIRAGAVPQAPMTTPVLLPSGQVRLSWQSQIGKTYQVQFKERLDQPFPVWANLDFAVVATATNSTVNVPIVGTTRFYRVVIMQ